jgi:hypothetical protein
MISDLLPSILSRAGRLDPQTMYMGREIDLTADPLTPTLSRERGREHFGGG